MPYYYRCIVLVIDIRSFYRMVVVRIRCYQLGGHMGRRKYITGDDYLLDETLLLDDEFDMDEYINDPMFDSNDHEYLQELNNDETKDGKPLPLDRYLNRFRKNY